MHEWLQRFKGSVHEWLQRFDYWISTRPSAVAPCKGHCQVCSHYPLQRSSNFLQKVLWHTLVSSQPLHAPFVEARKLLLVLGPMFYGHVDVLHSPKTHHVPLKRGGGLPFGFICLLLVKTQIRSQFLKVQEMLLSTHPKDKNVKHRQNHLNTCPSPSQDRVAPKQLDSPERAFIMRKLVAHFLQDSPVIVPTWSLSVPPSPKFPFGPFGAMVPRVSSTTCQTMGAGLAENCMGHL